MSDRWQRLRQRWAVQGVVPAPPASREDLAAFEAAHHIVLPADLRSYFGTVGGMDPRANPAGDPDGFAFWPLDQVEPATDNPGLFIIADYLNWSWAYAVTLQDTADTSAEVVLLGLATPQRVAETFSDFVDLYLAGSRQLYPT
jgi:hypothetical protein